MLKTSHPPEFNENRTIDEATSLFNTELLKALDVTAPVKSIKFTNKPKHPCFNKFIREQECSKNLEKKTEKVQTATPMTSIHEGEECLQQTTDLPQKANYLKEDQ